MPPRAMQIVQVGSSDDLGGAAKVPAALRRGLVARGHRVRHLVGHQRTTDPHVALLPDDDRWGYRLAGYTMAQHLLRRLAGRFPNRGFGRLSRSLRIAAHPRVLRGWFRGLEDFEFPASARLLGRLDFVPDILHFHNLHGGFFDLRALAPLSRRVATALTLHDMWTLTGHCAHSLDCDRWQRGCGSCPDLRYDPPIRRDATAENWQRKRAIYQRARLHVAVPSRWLADRVQSSMLQTAIQTLRVIHNGVDTRVFTPGHRRAARAALGLPADAFVVLLTTGGPGSMWKDDATLRGTMGILRETSPDQPVWFVAAGRPSALKGVTGARVLSLPYQRRPEDMAQVIRASDIYLHASRADTFPLAVLEALACGTPVVATAVGGIPEQIVSAGPEAIASGNVGAATGILVPARDAAAAASAIASLMRNRPSLVGLAANGAADVVRRFSSDLQVQAHIDWYREICD